MRRQTTPPVKRTWLETKWKWFRSLSTYMQLSVISLVLGILAYPASGYIHLLSANPIPGAQTNESAQNQESQTGGMQIANSPAEIQAQTYVVNKGVPPELVESLQANLKAFQEKSERDGVKSAQLLESFQWTGRWAKCLAQNSPQVEELARSIEETVARIELATDAKQPPTDLSLLVRIAKANVYQSTGRYADVLAILHPSSISFDYVGSEIIGERKKQMAVLRGQALSALGDDKNALLAFEEAKAAGVPLNLSFYVSMASTLIALEQYQKADHVLGDAIDASSGTNAGWLGNALNSRGVVLSAMDRFVDAQESYSKAIDHLATTTPPKELKNLQTTVHANRAVNYLCMYRLTDAQHEMELAIQFETNLRDSKESERQVAIIDHLYLFSQALAAYGLNELSAEYCGRAITAWGGLEDEEIGADILLSMADIYLFRSAMLRELGEIDSAVHDCNVAMELCQRAEIAIAGCNCLSPNNILFSRALILNMQARLDRLQGGLDDALRRNSESNSIIAQLNVTVTGPEYDDTFASNWHNIALANKAKGKLDEAEVAISNAIAINTHALLLDDADYDSRLHLAQDRIDLAELMLMRGDASGCLRELSIANNQLLRFLEKANESHYRVLRGDAVASLARCTRLCAAVLLPDMFALPVASAMK